MKIFWSWQSDTPGKIGRHFVRDALKLAIEELKQAPDVEEPTVAETREGIHLDHDRQGVTGSPDLARTIFDKIDHSAVFIADVTAVGTALDGKKKLINSNVGIEYGHAHKSLGDESILMVQNTYYGDRDTLPFDLQHKAGPIQFRLAPDATKAEIEAERKKLVAQLVAALRPFVARATAQAATPFHGVAPVGSPATFFEPHEVLGRIGLENVDEIEYRFAEARVFYIRVMPGAALPPLKHTQLMDIASQNRPDVLSQTRYSGYLQRNRFGVVALEPSGTSTTPKALTQLFMSGEIWGLTMNFFRLYQGHQTIPGNLLENIYRRVLSNYCDILSKGMGIAPPFTIIMGGIGLKDTYVGIEQSVEGPIHQDRFETRLVLNDLGKASQDVAVKEFIDGVLDLAGVTRA